MQYKGTAHKVGEHIDTDAIIPARFLVTTDARKLGANCMAGLEPDWVKRVAPGDILVAGRQLWLWFLAGARSYCHPGRGHARGGGAQFCPHLLPQRLHMGLLLLEVGDEVDKINDGDSLEIDAATGRIRDLTNGAEIICPPLPKSMSDILSKGGLVGYVKERLARQAQEQ